MGNPGRSMFHPTKRYIVIVLAITVIFGPLFQAQLSSGSGRDWTGLPGLEFGGEGPRPAQYSRDDGPSLPATIWGRPGMGGNKGMYGLATGVRYAPSKMSLGVTDIKAKYNGDDGVPRTEILTHAPGWTVFDQVYLFNGTWYIVVDNPATVPLLRMMTSTGTEIFNDHESIQAREPTQKDMRIVFPSQARRLWGQSASLVSGTTFLVNDPPQFLNHYYHFAAELLFGIWRTYISLDPTITANGTTHLASPSRMIFPHTPAGQWNDYAKMNSFISRAVFPSMSYEYQNDFTDRADTAHAFLFDRVVFADRAAALRGAEGLRTWRTASEAITLQASTHWWAPLRKSLLEFVDPVDGGFMDEDEVVGVGMEEELSPDEPDVLALEAAEEEKAREREESRRDAKGARSDTPVITYVSRQDWGRRMLSKESDESLITALNDLEEQYGWEVNVVSMDELSRGEQIRLASRTTIMLGVHGNGLTHLLWMNSHNPQATVIEFFYPGGFAEDYEFTARALGIKHYSVWNDTVLTAPDTPPIAYPNGFQGNMIPLDGKTVADLVVQRLSTEGLSSVEHEEEPDSSSSGGSRWWWSS